MDQKTKLLLVVIVLLFPKMNCKEKKFFYRCGADYIKQTLFPVKNNVTINEEKRKLSDDKFKDLNIYLDLVNIKKDIKIFLLEEYEELFISSLNKAVVTLESLLKVKSSDKNFYFKDEDIEKILIEDWNKTIIGTNAPKSMKELGIDLIIFGRFDDHMDESTLANAGVRYMDAETNQPLIGVVNINTKVNYSKINSQEYFQSIIIHEFTHILGFSKDYFMYLNILFNKTDEEGNMRFYINSPKVISVAKKYYNCSNIDGVELENIGGEGTAGSHWEARILLGEYMNGQIYVEEQVISEFTLALLEDTGYYKANYYTGGLMRYGKGKGCDFVRNKCVNSTHQINSNFENEFYDSIYNPFMDSSCSSGRQSRTYYLWWIYDYIPPSYRYFENPLYGGFAPADYCPVANEYYNDDIDSYYVGHCSLKGNGKYGTGTLYPYETKSKIKGQLVEFMQKYYYFFRSEDLYQITGETYSDHSFCYQSTLIKNNQKNIFNSNIVRATCYESYCSSKSLTIKINDDYIVCPRAGGKIFIEGYIGFFLCPDYNLICSGTILCNDMFDCVNKKSKIKNDSYIYDYKIKTSQNIENSYIEMPDDINNYELGEDGICPINCKECLENKKCIKCRINYSLLGSKENEEIKCISNMELSIGYYQNNKIYYKCISNCEICSNDKSCEKCSKGFLYFDKKC